MSDSNNLALIADNDITELNLHTSDETVNQLKLFLVAQAKNELSRIVKLTTYLDTIESQFISTSEQLIAEYPDNLSIISETMKTLMACINRSNELIAQVISDDKLNSFAFANKKVASEEIQELDSESRNKIRAMAAKLLTELNTATEDNSNEHE